MKTNNVSRTAQFMAFFRAVESSRPASIRLVDDRFAFALLPPDLGWAVRLSRLPFIGAVVPWVADHGWPGSMGNGIVRTRFIDDTLREALRAGSEQVVILGAGFDSRAYRIDGIERTLVFEVDHPTTQATKREHIKEMLGEIPPHVSFVAIDFNRQKIEDAMAASSFRPAARTFFIWEGVVHYLTPEAVDATLRYVSSVGAPGSRIIFTYIHRGVIDGSVPFEGAQELRSTVRRVGEPLVFGFDPLQLSEYLASRGLRMIEDVGAPEYRARYLDPMGRRMKLLEFYRAATAEVVRSA